MSDRATPRFKTIAPAKLNLFLELPSRRDDGYHEIDTVMIAIDCCDHLTLSMRSQPGVHVSMRWSDEFLSRAKFASHSAAPSFPDSGINLVTVALNQWCRETDFEGGFDVEVIKNIPAGAGMGGASSDAAAALRLADAAFQFRRTGGFKAAAATQLRQAASMVGSDVPFFLGDAAGNPILAARCTGRGEIIDPVEAPSEIPLVVVHPGITLSTAEVYRHTTLAEAPQSSDRFCQSFSADAEDRTLTFVDHMINRLSDPAKQQCAAVDNSLEQLRRAGLMGVHLTGSGSACFGVAENRFVAAKVAQELNDSLSVGAIAIAATPIPVPAGVQIC